MTGADKKGEGIEKGGGIKTALRRNGNTERILEPKRIEKNQKEKVERREGEKGKEREGKFK